MKRKQIWSLIILLALALSLTDGLSAGTMKEVSAAEGKKQTTEKVLIPEEKCWEYEENEDGTICITGYNDKAIYTSEKEDYDYERGITYKLIFPATIAGKKVICVRNGGSFFYHTYRVITSIKIPEGVTSIEGLGEYSIVSVELPSTLKEIGEGAFWSGIGMSSSLRSINIPNGVRYIGRYAFQGCDKLISIHLPSSLEEIDSEAFSGCWSLQNIVIPASVEMIGLEAFKDCRGMTAFEVEPNNKGGYYSEDGILYSKRNDVYDGIGIDIVYYPGSKKGVYNLAVDMDFGENTFLNCKGLTAINVASGHPYYSSVDGVVYRKDMKTLRVCPAGKTGEYTVPEGVHLIEWYSFSNSALHTIHLPDSLEEKYTDSWGHEDHRYIGGDSFYQCNNLQTITLGKNATEEILDELCDAPNLKNISISDKNSTLCTVDNIVYDKEKKNLLFIPSGRKGRLVLLDTVEAAGGSMRGGGFRLGNIGGTGITKLVLGKNYRVTEKKSVFDDEGQCYLYGLPELKNLQAYEVSSANSKLASHDGVLYSKDLKTLYHCPPQKKGTVTIPNGTAVIWGEAFSDCYGITEIIIPASVKNIFDDIDSDTTIKGYTGSAAEAYAKKHNIKFVSLDTVEGKKKKTSVVTVKKPKKVTLKKAKALGKRKVKVTWKRVTGVSGYQLQYAKNKKFKKAKAKTVKKTSFTIKKLKKKKTYYFRVRAYKLSGKKKVYGNWSKVKKVKVRK